MELESLPEEWELKSLIEVAEIKAGNPAPQKEKYFEKGDIPFVRMQDLGKYHRTTSLIRTTDKVNKQAIEECNLHIFPEGSVILPKSGSVYLNHRAILGINACVVSHIAILIPKTEVISEFLYYILLTIDMSKWGHKTTGLDSLNLRSLGKIKIPLPPIEEQKKIVEILQFADYLKEKIREAKELVDKIIMSVFSDMFGAPATNPKGWKVKKLSEIADVNPRNLLLESWNDEKEVGFIPMENIDEETGKIRQTQIKKLSQVRSGKTRFKENDVLFAKITPCVENKKVALARNLPSEIGFGSTEFHAIRAKDGITAPEFLLYLVRTDYIREHAISSMTGTSGRKRVPVSFLRNFNVPLPSLDLQQEFAEIVSKLEDKRKQMEEAEEKLEMLYQILLKQAFTGKLMEEWGREGNASKSS